MLISKKKVIELIACNKVLNKIIGKQQETILELEGRLINDTKNHLADLKERLEANKRILQAKPKDRVLVDRWAIAVINEIEHMTRTRQTDTSQQA
jgi:hypothetical protein